MDNKEASNLPSLVDPFLVKREEKTFLIWLFAGILFMFLTLMSVFLEKSIWFILFMMFFMILYFWIYMKMNKYNKEIAFIDNYQFPAGIKERISKHYPKLSDDQLTLVLQGLRQFFQLSKESTSKVIAMPSKVVDVAWHEFILMTASYDIFCQYGFGRFFHHLPSYETGDAAVIQESMKEAWYLACNWENIDQKAPSRLPFLFAIDTVLSIPDGFHHSLENDYASDRNFSCGGGFSGCGGC